MPPEKSYVTSHVHVDGPIPGPHSLLTVTAAALSANGDLISTYTVHLKRLHRATMHPDAYRQWARRPDDWLLTRYRALPAGSAMPAFACWVGDLPGPAMLTTDPDDPDHLFLYWYLHRFAGGWPFAETRFATAPGGHAMRECRLTGVPRPFPGTCRTWPERPEHTRGRCAACAPATGVSGVGGISRGRRGASAAFPPP